MLNELLSTRLLPPSLRENIVVRQRFIAIPTNISRYKVTLLQAPAGYGKTTLMAQWYQQLLSTHQLLAWLTVDSLAWQPKDFFVYLRAALGSLIVMDTAKPQQPSEFEPLLVQMANQLAALEKPVVVFLDGLQFLAAESLTLLARLIELASSNVHFVVASRSVPPLKLAAHYANNAVLVIGVNELAFNADELRCYSATLAWPESWFELLNSEEPRHEGWITGIQLAGLALSEQGVSEQTTLEYFGGHYLVASYFSEQVFLSQPEKIQTFLLQASLLENFCTQLCDAVFEVEDSRALLDQAKAAGLFLVATDQTHQWYRFHPLFSDFLIVQANKQGIAVEGTLLNRAAQWFVENDRPANAIELCLKASDNESAAKLLAFHCQEWAYQGRVDQVRHFIERIPRDVAARYPEILLMWVWHLIGDLRFEEAEKTLVMVKGLLTDSDQQRNQQWQSLNQLLLHREMYLAVGRDDSPLVESQCLALLEQAKHDLHPYLLSSVYTQLVFALRDQFQLKDIPNYAAKARGCVDRSGYDFAYVSVLTGLGSALYVMGKMDLAQQAFEEAVEVAVGFAGEQSRLAALPSLPLCALLYEGNDILKAEAIVEQQLEYAKGLGLVDQFIAGYVTQVRLLILQGKGRKALQLIDLGSALAMDRDWERLRLSLVVEHLRLLSLSQSASRYRIIQCARAANIPSAVDAVLPHGKSRSMDEFLAIAWFRVAMASDDFTGALQVAKSWRKFCESRAAYISYVRWGILMAQAQLQLTDARSAQRVLREAIAAAAPLGVCRSFIDEGQVILSLVESCCQAQSGSTHPTDLYALRLLEAFGGKAVSIEDEDTTLVYSTLADRELEVLQQVSLGMRNREVADKMGMTEGSIKWYMQQIFDKLGTRSRIKAVERARKLGLIS